MEPARIQLQEAVYALNDYLDRVELDPERLRQVEARMEAIHSAARKFRVTPDELPAEHADLSEKLQQLADASDLDGLRKQEAKAKASYMAAAGAVEDPRGGGQTCSARR
jgi:DNA repair protein RecN (Recombination protein N)